MNRALRFGDIIKVLPVTDGYIPNRDDRRWMVVGVASTSAARPWTTVFVGPLRSNLGPSFQTWPNMAAFEFVEGLAP
jgi:hypothetical protein